tara:strand:+ start:216 stop:920 length:705 start_codon:yes stop_codon:yes gene_type:complete
MIKLKSKKQEYELFNKLSDEWWNENGKFKVLHQIKPIRMSYIVKQLNSNYSDIDVLDIGCGGGLISEPLSRLGCNVTGIDFVRKNIQVAKKHAQEKNLKIKYLCEDIEKYKFKNKFDVIILFELLEHLDDWQRFLKKIIGVLKKDGKIIISTINRNIISKYLAILIAENILRWIPKNTHDFNKFIKPQEIKEFAKQRNLLFHDIQGMVFDPLSMSWKLSSNDSVNYFCTLLKSS